MLVPMIEMGECLVECHFMSVLTSPKVLQKSPRASKSSKSKMDAEELRNRPKRSFHLKKVQMEALRRRVRHHHCNSLISAPSYFLLKEIPVGTRCGFTRYNLDQEHNRQGMNHYFFFLLTVIMSPISYKDKLGI